MTTTARGAAVMPPLVSRGAVFDAVCRVALRTLRMAGG